MRFTEGTLRVIKKSEIEGKKTTNIVYPVHLLLAMLLEKTVVVAELYITYPNLWDKLNE